MDTPYINTTLETDILLYPHQMDNNLYKHIKNNLKEKIEGKCYSKYGYIVKIYEITDYSNGIIVPEDLTGVATFHVKFTCKLCRPIENQVIICKYIKNKPDICFQNGPIEIIVGNRGVGDKFFVDNKTNKLLYKLENNQTKEINIGDYVKATVYNIVFSNKSTNILSIGTLTDIATDDEIKKMFQDELLE